MQETQLFLSNWQKIERLYSFIPSFVRFRSFLFTRNHFNRPAALILTFSFLFVTASFSFLLALWHLFAFLLVHYSFLLVSYSFPTRFYSFPTRFYSFPTRFYPILLVSTHFYPIHYLLDALKQIEQI